jgi:hypothetical protein
MTWRNSNPFFPDRVCGALAYLLPLTGSLVFGHFIFRDFPDLMWLFLPTVPISFLYRSIPFGEMIVFILLFVGVIRNVSISHFIRFNVMQAILLDIVLFLITLVVQMVLNRVLQGIAQEVVYSTVFLGIFGAVAYSISQCLSGFYPDKIPGVSEAAGAQVPF